MNRADLLEFVQKHRLGVLSTVSPNGDPEAAVVGIAVTDRFEIVFDTIDTSRKCQNIRNFPKVAFVIGWDAEITVQIEGVADEPKGEDLDRLQKTYFAVYPECVAHQSWLGITYIRVRTAWARYSDFNLSGAIVEFSGNDLDG